MAEVIDLHTNIKTSSTELKNPMSVQLLNDFNKNPDDFEELIICFKKTNGSVGIVDTMPSIEDKCLFTQMMQHQIVAYLDRFASPVNPRDVVVSTPELDKDL